MFRIVNESILDQKVDAIVNPANSFLNHGGGLARIIDKAAQGNVLDSEQDTAALRYLSQHDQLRAAGPVATGAATLTSAGALPFKSIIHAVGPIWGGGGLHEADLLLSTYTRSILLAIDEGYDSIAMPAISMGIFGVPRDVVARAAVNAARRFAHHIDITICLTNDEDVAAFEALR